MHITIIDDEKILSNLIKRKLESNDHHVSLFHSYTSFCSSPFPETDMYIVDVSLGDGSGFDIVQKIRAQKDSETTPILMISWFDSVSTKVQWLDIWADDYLVKPFEMDELLARVRSLTRRTQTRFQSEKIIYGTYSFDLSTRDFFFWEKNIKLMKKEKQILELFLTSQDTLITKKYLAKKIWNRQLDLVMENIITVTICRLRKKLWNDFPLHTKIWEGYILPSY